MIFWRNLMRLVARRNVGLTAIVVAVSLAGLAFLITPTRYTSSAILVLTTSGAAEQSSGADNTQPQINPLLNFNEGLDTALAILVQAMNTREVLDEIAVDSRTRVVITDVGSAEFLGNKGPFLFIAGQSTATPEAARDIVVRAEQRTSQELLARQESLNAPESQLITALYVVEPTPPVGSDSTRFQYVGFAFVMGLLLVVGGAYLLEIIRGRRKVEPVAVDEPGPLEAAPPALDHAIQLVNVGRALKKATNGHAIPAAPAPSATDIDGPTFRMAPVARRTTDNDRPGASSRPKPRPSPHPRTDPAPSPQPRDTAHAPTASPDPFPAADPTPTERLHTGEGHSRHTEVAGPTGRQQAGNA